MFYTVRGLLNSHGIQTEDTIYRFCTDEMLDFRIASGDFYEVPDLIQGILRFKNTANLYGFDRVAGILPEIRRIDFPAREQFPYCCENLEGIAEALLAYPDEVFVEGGPCLFGEHEVTAFVMTEDGKERAFDYSTGKAYRPGQMNDYALSDDTHGQDFAEYVKTRACAVRAVRFENGKTGLTRQEYLHVFLPFATAAALGTGLVMTLPDMSYRKYLDYAIDALPQPLSSEVRMKFELILYTISDIYLELIERLQTRFQIRKLAVVHERNTELVRTFENARRPFIERKKILHGLTRNPSKLEAIKDYISMPALPYYLFGSRTILEVNSMDETDSYRKCRRAHRGTLNLGCLLFPELLSRDQEHTLYCAPLSCKDYGSA